MRRVLMILPRMMMSRRAAVVLLALAFMAPPATASAGADANISVQEKRLKWLEGLAAEKQGSVARTQESMRALAREIRTHNDALDALEVRYEDHQDQLIDTTAQYEELQRQMAGVAASTYMNGRVGLVEIVLDAQTMADMGDAVHFTGLVLSRTRQIARQTGHAATEIATLKSQDEVMIKSRAKLLRGVRREQDELLSSFAQTQEELEQIQAIRAEVAQLLASLRRKLRDDELARFGGTMPYGQWAEAFLRSIKAPTSRGNLVALVAWQLAEGTLARWNPLATTWRMPGSTGFNGHRVQNYVSLEQGLEATRKTLSRPGHRYEFVLQRLAEGAAALETAQAINASNWCRGCADGQYVVELIPLVERYYDKYAKRRA